MTAAINRRRFLTTALGAGGVAALPGLGRAATLESVQLTDRLSVLTGASGNMLAFDSGEGLVMVDSGAPEEAAGLREALRSATGADRVRTVINTHYHRDQTGGNAVLAESGAELVAHERTQVWMSAPIWVPQELRYIEARAEAARPGQTFYETRQLTVGGETIDCGYLVDAHTDGDIYAFFRDANVLAVGDVASPDRDPVFDWFAGGWLAGRVDAQARLIEMADADTRIVPAYGPVMSRAELAAEHAVLATLYERVNALFRQGRSAQDFLAEGALDDLPRTFSDPEKLMYDIHKGLWGHQDALGHDIV